MRKSSFVFAAVALITGLALHAQSTPNTGSLRYKWQDNQGLVHFSDSLSTEAMKFGYDVVNDRGMIVQHVPRQLSPEERAVANKLAAIEAAKQRAAQDRANAEAQMLAAYPDEASYRMSQQQQLDTIDQQIRTTQLNLRGQEKALADLLSRAGDIERAKKPVPKYLIDSIADQRNVVTAQRNALLRQQTERAQDVQQQARALTRYRELKAAQAQPAN